jgi:hypothetical protein
MKAQRLEIGLTGSNTVVCFFIAHICTYRVAKVLLEEHNKFVTSLGIKAEVHPRQIGASTLSLLVHVCVFSQVR